MLLRRFGKLASALLLAAAALTACSTAPKKQAQPVQAVPEEKLAQKGAPKPGEHAPGETAQIRLRVALLAPFSGPNEALGQALLNTATMALFDANDPGIQIAPRDTGETADSAAAAAQAAIDDGAQVILGPLTGPLTGAIAPVAAAHKIPVLSFSNDRLAAGNGAYVLGFLPGHQADRIVRFAAGRGLQRIAALIPQSPYGDRMLESLQAAAQDTGLKIVRVERYLPTQQSISQAMRRLSNYDARKQAMADEKAALSKLGGDMADAELKTMSRQDAVADVDFDALFIPDGGAALKIISPLLPYFTIDTHKVQVLGSGLWDSPATRREEELNGAWFATPPAEETSPLDQRYRQIYRTGLPKVASLAYDGIAMLATLNKAGDFSPAALENPAGFTGVNGAWRLTSDGVTQRGLAVEQVTPDAFLLLDPAPTGF